MTTDQQEASPGRLRRLALQRLKQRLEEDQMTTAELLKVAAMREEEHQQDKPPQGIWTVTLEGEDK